MVSATGAEASPFLVTRMGSIMRPEPADPRESGGVLNPGCARGRDGELYLFPRAVAEGNYSRIEFARVCFGADDNPTGVERLGIALEPQEPYERTRRSGGGCEDARVTYVSALDRYVLTYTALSAMGPRVALAVSDDLATWQRLGLADFQPELGIDWNTHGDKDAVLFPEPVVDPHGRLALALLHRPNYLVTREDQTISLTIPEGVDDARPSIWISYADLDAATRDLGALTTLAHHRLLAKPEAGWENLRISSGPPPLRTYLGWLLMYFGVGGEPHPITPEGPQQMPERFAAGVMVLDATDPRRVLHRSTVPILEPATPEECQGNRANTIVPTGLDPRTPPQPGSRVDVYYGMADSCIGAGWLRLPGTLPEQ